MKRKQHQFLPTQDKLSINFEFCRNCALSTDLEIPSRKNENSIVSLVFFIESSKIYLVYVVASWNHFVSNNNYLTTVNWITANDLEHKVNTWEFECVCFHVSHTLHLNGPAGEYRSSSIACTSTLRAVFQFTCVISHCILSMSGYSKQP